MEPVCSRPTHSPSPNTFGLAQYQRDDLESLGYVLVYFARGSLPWQGLKAPKEKKSERIKEMKARLSAKDLCGDLPDEFATYIDYIRSLHSDDKPDYSYLRKLFRKLFLHNGFTYDNVFDWTVKRYSEIYGSRQTDASHAAEATYSKKEIHEDAEDEGESRQGNRP